MNLLAFSSLAICFSISLSLDSSSFFSKSSKFKAISSIVISYFSFSERKSFISSYDFYSSISWWFKLTCKVSFSYQIDSYSFLNSTSFYVASCTFFFYFSILMSFRVTFLSTSYKLSSNLMCNFCDLFSAVSFVIKNYFSSISN